MKREIPQSAREVLARQPVPDEHPSADLLAGFAEQALPAAEKQRVTTHLEACAECREVVFLASATAEDEQHSTAAQHETAAAPRRSAWLTWKWLAPALAAIVIVGVVALDRPALFRSAPSPGTSTIARNTPSTSAATQANDAARDELKSTVPAQSATAPQARTAQAQAKKATGAEHETLLAERPRLPAGAGRLRSNRSNAPAATLPPTVANNSAGYEYKATTQPGLPSDSEPSSAPRAKQSKNAELDALRPKAPPQRDQADRHTSSGGNELSWDKDDRPKGGNDLSPVPPPTMTAGPVAGPRVTIQQSPVQANDAAMQSAEVVRPAANSDKAAASSLAKKKAKDASGGGVGSGAVGGTFGSVMSTQSHASAASAPHWRITSDGHLERGAGYGEWTRVLADQPVAFHAVAVVGNDVWAGGGDGALFHSSDGGQQWSRVALTAGGEPERGSVSNIRFDDTLHGSVSTVSGVTWTTSDGGKTWTRAE